MNSWLAAKNVLTYERRTAIKDEVKHVKYACRDCSLTNMSVIYSGGYLTGTE